MSAVSPRTVLLDRKVDVRFRDSSLEEGRFDVYGRVISTDRVGLLLSVKSALADDEVLHFIPWTSVELVDAGYRSEALARSQEQIL